jgi:DNA-binding PadR family transcriptional regulator
MEIDGALAALFGSDTRLRSLAVLANARHPMTAYRVAKVGGVRPTKAYPELHRLEKAGVVSSGRSGWTLRDRDVALLLRKRVRIVWEEDWFRGKAERDAEDRRRYQRLRRLPPPAWNGVGPVRYDVRRRRAKDEILIRVRTRPSVTHGRRVQR